MAGMSIASSCARTAPTTHASVGARPIMVLTGNGRKTRSQLTDDLAGIEVFDDLSAAASALLDD